jgi:hypothetical protein
VSVPFDVTALWLSPGGHYMAMSSDDHDQATTVHAGRVGGPLSTFTADDAAFVDEGRLLLLERHRTGSTLRAVHLGAKNADVWSLHVPVRHARLSFDRLSRQWCLLGSNADGDIVSAAGRVGESAVVEKLWKSPADDPDDDVEAISSSTSEVLTLESQSRPPMFGTGPFQRWAAIVQTGLHTESQIWTIGDHGRSALTTSRLDLQCRRLSTDGEAAMCTAFDGTRTRFFEVNPATRRLKALASVAGHFIFAATPAAAGWPAGGMASRCCSHRDPQRDSRPGARRIAGRRAGDHRDGRRRRVLERRRFDRPALQVELSSRRSRRPSFVPSPSSA